VHVDAIRFDSAVLDLGHCSAFLLSARPLSAMQRIMVDGAPVTQSGLAPHLSDTD
jgi:hypothetical protein